MTVLNRQIAVELADRREPASDAAFGAPPAGPRATRNRIGWSHLAGAFALAAFGVMVTRDAWLDIIHIVQRDEESSHIYLVPLVVAWLAWVRRSRLKHCDHRGLWIGPLMAAAGWLCYSMGDKYLIQSAWHGGSVLIAIGCVFTFLGSRALRAFLPVVIAAFFLVPVPGRVRQRIAIPLQTVSARATEAVLRMGDADVVRSGNLLSIKGVPVTIVEACNGMRMTFALGMVCFAFAFGTPLRNPIRILVMLATPASAVACNVIRLVPAVWIYGHYPSETARMFHDLSGWIMLFVSFGLLMAMLRLLRWAMVPVTPFTLAYD
jgi:exosortase